MPSGVSVSRGYKTLHCGGASGLLCWYFVTRILVDIPFFFGPNYKDPIRLFAVGPLHFSYVTGYACFHNVLKKQHIYTRSPYLSLNIQLLKSRCHFAIQIHFILLFNFKITLLKRHVFRDMSLLKGVTNMLMKYLPIIYLMRNLQYSKEML